jgi:hypothetical protein
MLTTLPLAAALSIVIAVLAAGRRSELTFSLAAFLFALQVSLLLLRINVPLWRDAATATVDWAWDNSILAAFTYGWGAAVMLTAYPLGGLVWQHWWQYGLGMALLGAGTLLCARFLLGRAPRSGRGLRALMQMTMAQTAAVAAALVYLLASGKLTTPKDDWAANVVFLAGGVTILLISLTSLQTYRRTRQP